MTISLRKVDFNHRPYSADTDGFGVRVNRTTQAPPWTPGGPQSYAAFALAAVRSDGLTIEATFGFAAPSLETRTVKVRTKAAPAGNPVIGVVPETLVPVAAEDSPGTSVVLALAGADLWNNGVGRFEFVWNWQVQWSDGGGWTTFASSAHVVYVTLALPNQPWTTDPEGPDQFTWPWTDVLDWSCAWAAGIGSGAADLGVEPLKMEAARAIEAGINALGQRRERPIHYYLGASFTDAIAQGFQLTKFLSLLRGEPLLIGGHSLPWTMNCSDCAAAMTTFANALGCDLSTHRMQRSRNRNFVTNPIIEIGATVAQTPTFAYHEVAVGPSEHVEERPVFDPCLRVDFDADPRNPPGDFALAAGLPRGAIGASAPLNYVQRLLPGVADVRGATMPPRGLDEGLVGAVTDVLLESWSDFKERIDRVAGPPAHDVTGPPLPVRPFVIHGLASYLTDREPFQLKLLREVTGSVEFTYTSGPSAGDDAQIVRVLTGIAKSERDARDAFAWLLTQSNAPVRESDDHPAAPRGRVVFFALGRQSAYVLRGRLFAQIFSEGAQLADLDHIVETIDAGFRFAHS